MTILLDNAIKVFNKEVLNHKTAYAVNRLGSRYNLKENGVH